MGDEQSYQRHCPDCGETLNRDARVCVCGWGKKSGKGGSEHHDHVCNWQYGTLRCRYPVGLFEQGQYRGRCIFHRSIEKGHAAAEIAKDSQGATREQYLAAANRLMYGAGDNPMVRKLRSQLKRRESGENVGILAARLLPEREPGADEAEAA